MGKIKTKLTDFERAQAISLSTLIINAMADEKSTIAINAAAAVLVGLCETENMTKAQILQFFRKFTKPERST